MTVTAGDQADALLGKLASRAGDPGRRRRSRRLNPRDPDNPNYNWKTLDEAINRSRANKLTPIVDVVEAPRWAWGAPSSPEPGAGYFKPSIAALASFAAAASTHYNGRSSGHPRVKYWQLWNEPNLTIYFKTAVRRCPTRVRGLVQKDDKRFCDGRS